jgi:hypothetical protein
MNRRIVDEQIALAGGQHSGRRSFTAWTKWRTEGHRAPGEPPNRDPQVAWSASGSSRRGQWHNRQWHLIPRRAGDLNGTNIYYIWYGDWWKDAGASTILTNFAGSIGGSPYFNINTTYFDSTNTNVTNKVTTPGA